MTETEFSGYYQTLDQRLKKALMALSFRLSLEMAEDVAHDAWIKAWQARGSFEGRSSFFTWLMTIAVNEIRCGRRKLQARKNYAVVCSLDCGRDIVDHQPDAQREIAARDAAGKIQGSINDADDQAIFHLHFLLGNEMSEVAEITGRTVPFIKSRIFRIRQRVREEYGSVAPRASTPRASTPRAAKVPSKQ